MDKLIVVGVNHKCAPLALREKLAFGPERIRPALHKLVQEGSPLHEAVLLSTCNRTEVYACGIDLDEQRRRIRTFLAERAGLDSGSLERFLYSYSEEAAADHLLSVAAGLDSIVQGENEILGQVKNALELARTNDASGPVLDALFRHAVRAGKRVRSETGLGKTCRSMATLVVELAQEVFGPIQDRTALLIGAGKFSSITGQALIRAGLRCVLVANRTYPRAERLAARLGGSAVHFDALADSLSEADIVICSTGAPHIVLHGDTIQQIMQTRPDRPLLVIDLAVPRDADPQIRSLPGVSLKDMDNLETLVAQRHPTTAAERQAAEAILSEVTGEFLSWRRARRAAPIIRALQENVEAACREQVEKTLRRLGDIPPEQKQALEVMAHSLAKQLLHHPIATLREGDGERIQLIEDIFGLETVSKKLVEDE